MMLFYIIRFSKQLIPMENYRQCQLGSGIESGDGAVMKKVEILSGASCK